MSTNVFAQLRQDLFYQYFISGNMVDWKLQMNSFANKENLSNTDKLELICCYYGYIGYSLGIKRKDEAKLYIEKGDKLIDELINDKYSLADAYALKGAFVGFKIGVSPYKAPFIGNSSSEAVDQALTLDKDNIQGNIEKGNILYYSPNAFGGDKNKAILYYLKAVSLFEKNSAKLQNNWEYLNLLTNIGKAYSEMKQYTEAKKYYDKILKLELNYKYVKDELYPELLKRIK